MGERAVRRRRATKARIPARRACVRARARARSLGGVIKPQIKTPGRARASPSGDTTRARLFALCHFTRLHFISLLVRLATRLAALEPQWGRGRGLIDLSLLFSGKRNQNKQNKRARRNRARQWKRIPVAAGGGALEWIMKHNFYINLARDGRQWRPATKSAAHARRDERQWEAGRASLTSRVLGAIGEKTCSRVLESVFVLFDRVCCCYVITHKHTNTHECQLRRQSTRVNTRPPSARVAPRSSFCPISSCRAGANLARRLFGARHQRRL